MCGIVGIVDFANQPVARADIQRMTDRLQHRGPDATGVLCRDSVGLGHTRLSIIDTSSAGNQPMVTPDARYAITYNGEVYNHLELRQELEKCGEHFSSRSDTEVLLRAFARWGVACFSRIKGMFGLAIYDFQTKTLLLARDRFGKKPVHYVSIGRRFWFASEIKALTQSLPTELRPDRSKLFEFLLYRELIQDNFLEGVQNVPPGHYLVIDESGHIEAPVPYFRIQDLACHDLYLSLGEMRATRREDRVDEALTSAVDRRLVSDVPIGTLCSGGLDSSLLTAIACRLNRNVTVYHVDVAGASERTWGDRIAKHLGIDLRVVAMNERSFLENYVACIYHNDFPLTHTNSVGVYLVSALAREHGCKVLLTGEGADETFGGYDWRYSNRLAWRRTMSRLTFLHRVQRRVMLHLTNVWALGFNPAFNFKARANVDDVVDICSDGGFRRKLLQSCVGAMEFIPDPIERDIQASMLSDLQDYIAGILHRQDRASMQASVESRVPFLDPELAQVAINLPLHEKLSTKKGKLLLKRVAIRYLPEEVVYRPKVGFGSPSDSYILKIRSDIFNSGALQRYFDLPPATTHDLIARCPSDYANALYGLEIWGRLFLDNESIDSINQRFMPSFS